MAFKILALGGDGIGLEEQDGLMKLRHELDVFACINAAEEAGHRLLRDVAKAMRIADRIEVGTVYINNYFNATTQSPVGGFKQSGYGRENGFEGMRCFMQTKSVWLATDPQQPDPFPA